jgi:MerR family transcriptional regulator, light-induced transcriptional regulator
MSELSNFRSSDVYSGHVSSADLRIGEVARRTCSTPEVLRVWERRYGVLRPARTAGGFRLYSEDDVARVLRMRELLDQGVGTAEAARAVLEADVGRPDSASGRDDLLAAIVAFDEPTAQAVLDRLLDERTVESVLRDVVLPVLAEIGHGWEHGTYSVAQEHFGSNLLRGRIVAIGRGWSQGVGPRALLACPPGELHDLGLVVFGVALNRLGWRIAYLGTDTPLETLAGAATAVDPAAIVLAHTWRGEALAARGLREVAKRFPVFVGGAAVDAATAARVGARRLEGDPVTAAGELARSS